MAAEGQFWEDIQFSFDHAFPKLPVGTLTYHQSCTVSGESGTRRRSKAKTQFGGAIGPSKQ